MRSDTVIYIPSFVNIGSGFARLIRIIKTGRIERA
jgi:hypothetical protein